jgi:hypothetical protein
MNWTVISYVYNPSDFADMPRLYRQHIVPNINDPGAIDAQVRRERGDVPDGCCIDWTR